MKHPLYSTWHTMRNRCSNPNNKDFAYYGGRGVRVCDRWQVFANFVEDMGPKPSRLYSIDRIDSSGNYEPGNCRWATPQQQQLNRRIPNGKDHFAAKLTEAEVAVIRILCAVTPFPKRQIASWFGVSEGLVFNIKNRRIWRHI